MLLTPYSTNLSCQAQPEAKTALGTEGNSLFVKSGIGGFGEAALGSDLMHGFLVCDLGQVIQPLLFSVELPNFKMCNTYCNSHCCCGLCCPNLLLNDLMLFVGKEVIAVFMLRGEWSATASTFCGD